MAQNLAVEAFRHALFAHGLEAALAFLNEGVPHRYTAAYQVDGRLVRQLAVFDKAGREFPEAYVNVPIELSLAQYVVRDGMFRTQDSSSDCRLAGHPYRGVLASYQGVAVYGENGAIMGTLCHFDVDSKPISDEEFALILACATCFVPDASFSNGRPAPSGEPA